MKKVTFKTIVHEVAQVLGTKDEIVSKSIRLFFERAWELVKDGYEVSTPGLGTLSKTTVAPKMWKNFRTQVSTMIPEHDRPRVKFSDRIRRYLRQ